MLRLKTGYVPKHVSSWGLALSSAFTSRPVKAARRKTTLLTESIKLMFTLMPTNQSVVLNTLNKMNLFIIFLNSTIRQSCQSVLT